MYTASGLSVYLFNRYIFVIPEAFHHMPLSSATPGYHNEKTSDWAAIFSMLASYVVTEFNCLHS